MDLEEAVPGFSARETLMTPPPLLQSERLMDSLKANPPTTFIGCWESKVSGGRKEVVG